MTDGISEQFPIPSSFNQSWTKTSHEPRPVMNQDQSWTRTSLEPRPVLNQFKWGNLGLWMNLGLNGPLRILALNFYMKKREIWSSHTYAYLDSLIQDWSWFKTGPGSRLVLVHDWSWFMTGLGSWLVLVHDLSWFMTCLGSRLRRLKIQSLGSKK